MPADGQLAVTALTAQRQSEKTQDLLVAWLRAYAGACPLLFIVEDLHWADPSTIELLTRHVKAHGHGCGLTVLTFRPEFQTTWPSLAHQTQIALNRLTRKQVGEMLKKRLKRETIPEPILMRLVERSDGVPLFVEEFATLIAEAGLLEHAGRELSSAAGVLEAIPVTLQDLLAARLDRLECDPDLVQLAATIGREFSYELIASISDRPRDQIDAELAKLLRAEIVFANGSPPRCTYLFKHALIQDAAYRSLVKKRRQEFHLKIALAIEQGFPEIAATQPELLARHFTGGGQPRRAFDYWLAAGKRSQARYAAREAINSLTRGLELLAALPSAAERDALELSAAHAAGGRARAGSWLRCP